MGKIIVCQFWSYDGTAEKSELSPFKRTADEIKRMVGYTPDMGTAEEVDSSDLDLYGRYHPKTAS